MYGYPDNSPCKICGDTNDPCMHVYYSDEDLFKELERGYIINAKKNYVKTITKKKEATKTYKTEIKNA